MYKIMWETLSLVNLLQSHTSQKQSTTRWARSTCTAELWLDNVLRIHTSKGRAVRPWTGSGNSRWCVVIGGQTPNVWARPCTPYCSMLMQTNGSQGTRGDLCAVSEVLMRAYGWSAPSMLVRRRRGNASCTKQGSTLSDVMAGLNITTIFNLQHLTGKKTSRSKPDGQTGLGRSCWPNSYASSTTKSCWGSYCC